MNVRLRVFAALGLLLAPAPLESAVARIKELAAPEGVRDNQLLGYGLVVGLAGTGDKRQTIFSAQSLTNLLQRFGISVSPTAIQVRNTAAVLVTATLPPFAQPGSRIDVTAAAIGDATTLQGGLLVRTELRGADGRTYAVAQGSVVTGGFVSGRGNNSQSVNHPTAGRISSGAIVEQKPPSVNPEGQVRLQLIQPDFTTATRIAQAINKQFAGNPPAHPENAAVVVVETPPAYKLHPVELMSLMENLEVNADSRARIIINERTGTIVLGRDVHIAPVAILHGNLSVEIRTSLAVSQPEGFSQGKTAVVPQTEVKAQEERARSVTLKEGATVDDLVRALTAIGSTPRDVIAVLQNLRAAGALEADLEII
ncbi:MAG: flagellar basal body P-ring protein FlgI [Bryobacterales bacterium]|nr:flagellar basal body P-ring protein FlgI [Bryobacterales bacterium]